MEVSIADFTYKSSKKLAPKINDYGWKYGRSGWTNPAAIDPVTAAVA
jgi:hypothetical protein